MLIVCSEVLIGESIGYSWDGQSQWCEVEEREEGAK